MSTAAPPLVLANEAAAPLDLAKAIDGDVDPLIGLALEEALHRARAFVVVDDVPELVQVEVPVELAVDSPTSTVELDDASTVELEDSSAVELEDSPRSPAELEDTVDRLKERIKDWSGS